MKAEFHGEGEGLGFWSVLQLIFIVLKLCKVINWSWWWVFSPTLIYIGIIALFLILMWIASR